jgi:hypothetical protein
MTEFSYYEFACALEHSVQHVNSQDVIPPQVKTEIKKVINYIWPNETDKCFVQDLLYKKQKDSMNNELDDIRACIKDKDSELEALRSSDDDPRELLLCEVVHELTLKAETLERKIRALPRCIYCQEGGECYQSQMINEGFDSKWVNGFITTCEKLTYKPTEMSNIGPLLSHLSYYTLYCVSLNIPLMLAFSCSHVLVEQIDFFWDFLMMFVSDNEYEEFKQYVPLFNKSFAMSAWSFFISNKFFGAFPPFPKSFNQIIGANIPPPLIIAIFDFPEDAIKTLCYSYEERYSDGNPITVNKVFENSICISKQKTRVNNPYNHEDWEPSLKLKFIVRSIVGLGMNRFNDTTKGAYYADARAYAKKVEEAGVIKTQKMLENRQHSTSKSSPTVTIIPPPIAKGAQVSYSYAVKAFNPSAKPTKTTNLVKTPPPSPHLYSNTKPVLTETVSTNPGDLQPKQRSSMASPFPGMFANHQGVAFNPFSDQCPPRQYGFGGFGQGPVRYPHFNNPPGHVNMRPQFPHIPFNPPPMYRPEDKLRDSVIKQKESLDSTIRLLVHALNELKIQRNQLDNLG